MLIISDLEGQPASCESRDCQNYWRFVMLRRHPSLFLARS